jgi:ParB-like chromosome segregation protein Spo0J
MKTKAKPKFAPARKSKPEAKAKAGKGNGAPAVPIRCSFAEMRDAAALVPHPRNPNKHPAEQIELFARIIQHQGIRRPIVVSKRSGFVVSGHGLLQAALKAGIAQLPVDIQDFKNEADEWAHLIADNRLAELSELQRDNLGELLRELNQRQFDLALAGFKDGADLKELLETIPVDNKPLNEEEMTQTKSECPKCGFQW